MQKTMGQFTQILGLAAAFAVMPMAVWAIPFDTTTSGGTATVGTGGDYATLQDASTAFNALTSPFLQGNWKLEVLNDLTEPNNSGFGNTMPVGSSLTLKPAASTSCTLTFTALVDNGGASGNLLIGTSDVGAWSGLKTTNNFIVDGSNNGSSTKNLTVTNDPTIPHSFSCPLVVVGDSNDVTFKNLTVINRASPALNLSSMAGISAVSRSVAPTVGPVLVPDNVKIQNCDIFVPQTQGHGVLTRISGTTPLPTTFPSITGLEVSNCMIEARIRAIFLDAGMDATIVDNTVRCGAIGAAVNGYLQVGVGVNNARSNSGQILNVFRNSFYLQSANVSTGDYGVAAFNLVTGGSGNTVNFVNNMANFRFTSTTTAKGKVMSYMGFRATSGLTYNILHNSFNMPNFANLDSLTPNPNPASGTAGAIKLPPTVSYTATILNNIIRLDQVGTAAINIAKSAGTPTVTSNNNVIYRTNAGAITGASGAPLAPVNYVTLADWQTGVSQDANSVVVDPMATTGSQWAPSPVNADLHFVPAANKPVELVGMPAIASVPNDIDGDVRNTAGSALVYPGADEGLVPVPVALSGFSLE